MLNERIKLSNEEKYLMLAIMKYEKMLRDEQDQEKIVEFLTKQFVYPKAILDRPLRKDEAIEIMKYLNKPELLERISQIKVPEFSLNYKDLNEHKMFDEDSNSFFRLEDYSKLRKIRFNFLLNDLKNKWIDSNFKLTNQELLKLIDLKYLQEYIKTKQTKNKK